MTDIERLENCINQFQDTLLEDFNALARRINELSARIDRLEKRVSSCEDPNDRSVKIYSPGTAGYESTTKTVNTKDVTTEKILERINRIETKINNGFTIPVSAPIYVQPAMIPDLRNNWRVSYMPPPSSTTGRP